MKDRKGQGLVEFALLIPVLLLILLGLVEAALLTQGYLVVQHAAREAARFAVTYQPLQGACADLDGDGQLEDGFNTDPDDLAPYPFCPIDHAALPGELDAAYYGRRVDLIKKEAIRAAAGLRISFVGDTVDNWEAHKDKAGFFGIIVRGYPSFLTDCNDPTLHDKQWNPADAEPGCLDHPGLEGLPVQVAVRHNVEIIDPFYRAVVEFVPVRADTQMINEGIQVGFGDMPPPSFETGAGGEIDEEDEGDDDTGDDDTGDDDTGDDDGDDDYTYSVQLAPENATNELPGDREHVFVATVTNEESQVVQGASVSFSTDEGGFSYSGASPQYVEETTNAQGQASVTLFGNQPGMASIHAWVDYNGNDTLNGPLEPSDVATKTWTVSGPYITVSSHEVIPLDGIHIDVMDHDPGDNPHRLLWCVISGTTSSDVVTGTLYVDASGDATDLSFTIPQDTEGTYRLESHSGSGDCGEAGDLVAYSADVYVTAVPPDLRILSISWTEEYGDLLPVGTSIPFTMVVENNSPTPVEGADVYFDVDFYLDPPYPPPFQGQVGVHKQWLQDIGPHETRAVHATFEFNAGEHYLYGQVDTSDYVAGESDEDNNVSEPYTLTVRCPIHDEFDDGLVDPAWTRTGVGGASGSASETGDEWLRIRAYGSRIWSSSDNFYYVHQSMSGDFDARLRIVSVPQCDQYSKMGLMVRDTTDRRSRHVSMLQTRSRGLQLLRRYSYGGDTSRDDISSSGAVWVRIVRSGDTFGYYSSTAGDPGVGDWTYHASVDVSMSDPVQVGIAHAAYGTCWNRNSHADEIMVCPPSSTPEVIRPPGLLECQQLFHVGGFEGNPDTVFEHWNAGEPLAYQHQSRYFSEGSMSMRLHASMGSYPACPAYDPYLWQAVEIPQEVYTMTTLVVQGQRLVAGSLAPCSYPDTPEADDVLYLKMRDSGGSDLSTGTVVVTGGIEMTRTWEAFTVDMTSVVNPYDHPGEEVQVYFYADHDDDYYDTWFYLDALECQACAEWPIPDEVPGTATIGGEVRVLVSGFPQRLQGVDVWAYKPGGEVLYTVTIQQGRYHFYNVEPGTYTIYAEIWIGGGLHFAMTTVTVGADERRDNVDLFLP